MVDEWGPLGPLVGEWESDLGGLDYKTAMWRDNEDDPFHTEVGYWLWDGATGENKYLAEHASTLSYTVTITTNGGDTWSYDETTMLKMDEIEEPFAHTDHNTLRKVG